MDGVAGVVLAGGRSTRMGSPKAELAWHGSTVLRRVVGIVARAVDGPVLVVAAPGQRFADLPADVEVVHDPVDGRGPLQGLAVGVTAAARVPAEVVFVCSTDLPLLHPAVVRCIVRCLRTDVDVALPWIDGHRQPLAAAYRSGVAEPITRWVAAGERRVSAVVDRLRAGVVGRGALLADPAVRTADPNLLSFRNLNRPAEYRAALALPKPEVVVCDTHEGSRVVRASTVTMAATAAGYTFGVGSTAALEGRIVTDGSQPLAAGDVLTICC